MNADVKGTVAVTKELIESSEMTNKITANQPIFTLHLEKTIRLFKNAVLEKVCGTAGGNASVVKLVKERNILYPAGSATRNGIYVSVNEDKVRSKVIGNSKRRG